MNVFALQSHQIAQHWVHVEPHLRRLERRTKLVSADCIAEACKQALKQLWLAENDGRVFGVVVTEIYPTPRGDICCIWATCGSAPKADILAVYDHIERWARGIGCAVIEIKGRRGWERLLKGFRRTAVVLEKSLA
jgi:hypothetical protein